MRANDRRLTQALLIMSGAIMASSVVFAEARAHEFYSEECCDQRDCRPEMFAGEVRETTRGYEIPALKQTIPYRDSRIKSSPDKRFHLCLFSMYTPGVGSALAVRCLYVPPRSF